MNKCLVCVMNLIPRGKLNSSEFNFLMDKIESFEKSTQEMSKSLENVLIKLTELVSRQEEKIKSMDEKQDSSEKALQSFSKEVSITRLLLASMGGGLAVLTFIAAETGVVKMILNVPEPPAVHQIDKAR